MYIWHDEIFHSKDCDLGYFTHQYASNCLMAKIEKDDSSEQEDSYLLIRRDGSKTPIKKVDKYDLLLNDDYKGVQILCTYRQYFAESDNMIMCNNLLELELEQRGGFCKLDEEPSELFQAFIIDDNLASVLLEHTREYVAYYEPLDIHVLGVSHWGTSWDCVGAEYII